MKKIKLIATLGPSTNSLKSVRALKGLGVNYLRANLSHTEIEELERLIDISKNARIKFILDTEGSQIRTGIIPAGQRIFKENDIVKIYGEEFIKPKNSINLKPGIIVSQLEEGDILHMGFDDLILRIINASNFKKCHIIGRVILGGIVKSNQAVFIDRVMDKPFYLPPLTQKDYKAIEIGLKKKIRYISLSYVRRPEDVDFVRTATKGKMQVISKIECREGLISLNKIIDKSDCILIDRNDLRREITLEKVPVARKIIISKSLYYKKPVYVASNLLETMIYKRRPTSAEVNDVVSCLLDGASGLILSGETAIGKYPLESVRMMNSLIKISHLAANLDKFHDYTKILIDRAKRSRLIKPHGGKLVHRIISVKPNGKYLSTLKKVKISEGAQMDLEQIAYGSFSPLEGFMNRGDYKSVLNKLRLKNGIVWPIPIILDVGSEEAKILRVGEKVVLIGGNGRVCGTLDLDDIFSFDKDEYCVKIYGAKSNRHPGVKFVKQMGDFLLGGRVSLLARRDTLTKEYELTPRQIRKIFEERGWTKVVGFHTRNVIHRSHEFIQLKAYKDNNCDGIFIHPIIGKKKPGDYKTEFIIKSYEEMVRKFYPKNKVVFSTFVTYSRYAGPREALFTAICRKNFGCSHFIVGRDHTGVDNFYHSKAAHEIFDKFQVGIQPVRFNEVFYSKRLKKYVQFVENMSKDTNDQLSISGTQARKIFLSGNKPPSWFMRPEISGIILDAIKKGEKVFEEK